MASNSAGKHNTNKVAFRKPMAATVFHFAMGLVLGFNVFAQGIETPSVGDTPGIIPLDPATFGYKVNNEELQFKEHVVLPKNMTIRGGGMLDSRYRLANLTIDEHGNYEQEKFKKIILVDSLSGDIKLTPYTGDIRCFVDGNLATWTDPGKRENSVFSYGKFGETLQTWKGAFEPHGMVLNLMSCKLQSREDLRLQPPAGMKLGVVNLRSEHGRLLTLEGQPLPSNTLDASPEVQRLMQQPFMRNMTLPAETQQWFLKKTDGELVPIPNNPGEATGALFLTYVPYLDAYFMDPAMRSKRSEMPRFARLLYPDGRVVRFGIPDILNEPSKRGEVAYRVLYTRAGLVWKVHFVRNDRQGHTTYKGDLQEGYYLDQRDKKMLTKIPTLEVDSTAGMTLPYGISNDGCRVSTRTEVTQKRPHYLFNYFYINLCTGE